MKRSRWGAAALLAIGLVGSACDERAGADADAPDSASLADAGDDEAGPERPDGGASADASGPRDSTTRADVTTASCPPAGVDTSRFSVEERGRFRVLRAFAGDGLKPRDVAVWLPASYDDAPRRRYPVLYMHDGQNLFSAADAAFGVEWGVDETVDALVAEGVVEELIVVGIDNTDERLADYSPTPDPQYGGGHAPRYVDWLADAVKPVIDTLFRTRCEASQTGIAGSSMGGLVSLYAMMVRPDAFGRAAVISPSLWWDDGALLDAFDQWSGPLPERLWIDMGTAEGDVGPLPATVASVRRARDRALALGLPLGDRLGYLEAPGAAHNEASWRARLGVVLRFLYGGRPLGAPERLRLGLFMPTLDLSGQPWSGVFVEAQAPADHVRLTLPNGEVAFAVSGDAVRLGGDGTVTATHAGAATVTATWAGLTASADVHVTDGASATVDVTFVATVPAATPPGDTVYLTGDAEALGAWDPAAVPMTEVGAHRWSVTVSLPSGAWVEYKFTRGSWATVESNGAGGDIGNRVYGPAAAETVEDTVAGWLH